MLKTPRTKVSRVPQRGSYDKQTLYAILDEALIGHVAFITAGSHPAVIPTLIARDGDDLLIHGSNASRAVRALRAGQEACIEVTHVDGIVLARSAFHHSMNYRSAIVYGTLQPAPDKAKALELFTEKLTPGRWEHVRRPNEQELKGTEVLTLPITEGSSKIRTGPPGDDEPDYALDTWAGVIPISTVRGEPIPDPVLREGIETPDHVKALTTR
jgi:uncharacterized protein